MHSESPKITIALDGFAACGKSTLARDLCTALNYSFIDTGAMYRAVTYCLLQKEMDLTGDQPWGRILQDLPLAWKIADGQFRIALEGLDIEDKIRSMAVSSRVSEVAAISGVRTFLVRQQQLLGRAGGVVLDGRDIGTVVFPDAELKIFVTADTEVRVQRRFSELQMKGVDIPIEEVRNNLAHRDHIDSTREDSPLQAAPDAVWLDTTRMDRKRQLGIALAAAQSLLEKKGESPSRSTVVP